jgi:hypothetical protein
VLDWGIRPVGEQISVTDICLYSCHMNRCSSLSSPQPPTPPPSSVIASFVRPFNTCYRCYKIKSLRRLGSSVKFLFPFHSQFQVFIGIPTELILSNYSLRLLYFYFTNSITCETGSVLVTSVCRRFCKIVKSDYYLRCLCPSAWNNSASIG